jgi:hypothetical protein
MGGNRRAAGWQQATIDCCGLVLDLLSTTLESRAGPLDGGPAIHQHGNG